jgi:hypothetical protein
MAKSKSKRKRRKKRKKKRLIKKSAIGGTGVLAALAILKASTMQKETYPASLREQVQAEYNATRYGYESWRYRPYAGGVNDTGVYFVDDSL